MSWIQNLFETYESCASFAAIGSEAVLTPLYHLAQQAHIEIALDSKGNFRRANVISKEETIIPATEQSATARTSAVVPHPLCDHIKYCAGDYREGDEAHNEYFGEYLHQLREWCKSAHSHPKAVAILNYVEKQIVLNDLVKEGVVPVDSGGYMLKTWESKEDKPFLLKQLTADKGAYKPQNALIRWRVEFPDDPVPEVWKDASLQDAWINFCLAKEETKVVDLCMVTGIKRFLATKHPNRIRGGKDNAKLISNKKEEDSDFIYLGRFLRASEAAGVGIEVSQKAHNALQWLIKRQSFRNGDQVIVAWAIGGTKIPDPFTNSAALFDLQPENDAQPENLSVGDAEQTFALRLRKYIAGYRTVLGSTKNIVVMALDSASPGRMAITYYRELTGSEFLDRVETWHEVVAWFQNYPKGLKFVGAPSLKDIAEAAYGRAKDDGLKKLHKATVERLLPCIVDGQQIPRDLMETTMHRTSNRAGLDDWEFEKNLGIACALFRGYFKERSYRMALERDRTARDYLYGRLLAVADHIEGRALHLAGENRETNASRLMQRFADHPYSTWRNIELSLSPYKNRLRTKRPSFLNEMERQLDEINGKFQAQHFVDDRRLSGEFLLGYHCQRQALRNKVESNGTKENDVNETTGE